MKMRLNNVLAGTLGISLASVLALSALLTVSHRDLSKMEAGRDLRLKYEKQRSGSIQMGAGYADNGGFLNYDLRSFDGGKVWYAVEREPGGGFRILGEADTIYPDLRQSLAALDQLTDLGYSLQGLEPPARPTAVMPSADL